MKWVPVLCTILSLLIVSVTKAGRGERTQRLWEMTNSLLHCRDFPGGAMVKSPPANAGDLGSSPGLGRSQMPRNN